MRKGSRGMNTKRNKQSNRNISPNKFWKALSLVIPALCLSACGIKPGENSLEEPEVLVLAAFEENGERSRQVELFNETHDDYKIEVQMYERSEKLEEDGRARIQREIISGKGPDLIDFGTGYATSDIVGRYTENLLPYLEDSLDKDEYFWNIWEAFSYKEGLYALPVGFTLQTFAGTEEMLGGRDHWTIQEMMETYETHKEDMLLYPGEFKKDVFASILTGSMEYYIDWENSACSFDGEEFQKVLEFAGGFPDSLSLEEDFNLKQTFLDGGALLLPLRLSDPYDICHAEFIFGDENISYIGFPTKRESGTVVIPSGSMLAVSISSGHKDICWEFISQFLSEDYQRESVRGLPVRRSVLEEKLAQNLEPEYTQEEDGTQEPIAKYRIFIEGEEPVEVYNITKEQAGRLMHLIETADMCAANDMQLYYMLLEEADQYFTGNKTLLETVQNIQSRAVIYVSERAG